MYLFMNLEVLLISVKILIVQSIFHRIIIIYYNEKKYAINKLKSYKREEENWRVVDMCFLYLNIINLLLQEACIII